MTVEQISSLLWQTGVNVMNVSFPVGQYNVTFMQLFIFAIVGKLLFMLVNRALDRRQEEEIL